MTAAIAFLDLLPLRLQAEAARAPRILVFDSGLGGLSVLAEIVKLLPGADYLYAADDAVFPYGALSELALVERVLALMTRLVAQHRPDIVVIACNTASTLVLPPLRARWPALPFVGTVPAIKPAAAASQSRMISVLATPGTVAREYTQALIRSFAADCAVALVGAPQLAGLCEAAMRGESVADAAILAEVAPAFVARGGQRTDVVVLACTHYPLLGSTLRRLAPWPVAWVDPAPAIARRVGHVLGQHGFAPSEVPRPAAALFTRQTVPAPALRQALLARGIERLGVLAE